MVAITSNPTTSSVQQPVSVPPNESRVVPDQIIPLSSPDSAVSATPQSTQTNSFQPPPQPTEQTERPEAVSSEDEQLRRVALEASATREPVAEQQSVEPRSVERVEPETNTEVAVALESTTTAETATVSSGSSAALSTYRQVSSLSSESARPQQSQQSQQQESFSSPPISSTPPSNSPASLALASTEQQVFGGAIDPSFQ